jgi:hypothetical protein
VIRLASRGVGQRFETYDALSTQPDQARWPLIARVSLGAGLSRKRGVKLAESDKEGVVGFELRRDGSKRGCRTWNGHRCC